MSFCILQAKGESRQSCGGEIKIVTCNPHPFLRRGKGADQRLAEQIGIGAVDHGERRIAPGLLNANAQGVAALAKGQHRAEGTVIHLANPLIAGIAGRKVANVRQHGTAAQRVFILEAKEIRAVKVFQLSHMVAEYKLGYRLVVNRQIGEMIGCYRLVPKRREAFEVG
ncbi:hypothetical protein D3C84_757940 [compost metagenome]